MLPVIRAVLARIYGFYYRIEVSMIRILTCFPSCMNELQWTPSMVCIRSCSHKRSTDGQKRSALARRCKPRWTT